MPMQLACSKNLKFTLVSLESHHHIKYFSWLNNLAQNLNYFCSFSNQARKNTCISVCGQRFSLFSLQTPTLLPSKQWNLIN